MTVEKYYRRIAGLTDQLEALECIIHDARKDVNDTRDNQPWVSAGWLSDADRLVDKLNKIAIELESILLNDEAARQAVEYIENGYVDDEVA